MSVEQGFTNNNLVVGYDSGHNNDSLAKTMDLRKIVKVPQESVTVGAGQTVYAPINFKMANQSFDGTVVGAVVVTKDVPGKAVKKSGFTNQFTYVKGVKIAETDKQVNANLTEAKKGVLLVVRTSRFSSWVLLITKPTTSVICLLRQRLVRVAKLC